MWAAAQFNRLRMLSHENTVLPHSHSCMSQESTCCMFFNLYVFACQGLTFWQELLRELLIGDTKSVVGCYKLLAALRYLAEWVTTTFKDRLELKVLRPTKGMTAIRRNYQAHFARSLPPGLALLCCRHLIARNWVRTLVLVAVPTVDADVTSAQAPQ